MIPDFPDSEAAGDWVRTCERLKQGRRTALALPSSNAFYFKRGESNNLAFSRWSSMNAEFRPVIESMIDRWLTLGIVDDSSEQARWLFLVRFEPAIDFVAQTSWSRGHLSGHPELTTFLPFPQMSVDQVTRTLLVPWWDQVGITVCFEQKFALWNALQSKLA
ncbi:MAG: hypothetical protein QM755_04235 [Luteolibacter sp.]